MAQTRYRKAQDAKKVSAPVLAQAQPQSPVVSPLLPELRKRPGTSLSGPGTKRPKLSDESDLVSPEAKGKGIDPSVLQSAEAHQSSDDDYEPVTLPELNEDSILSGAESDAFDEDSALFIPGPDTFDEVDPSREAFREQRTRDVAEIALQMGAPEHIMSLDSSAPWIAYLLCAVSLYVGLKDRISTFVDNLTSFARSREPVLNWKEDTERKDWHCHCPEITRRFTQFCESLLIILGENLPDDFDIARLVKPTGPFGGILYTQWNYPVLDKDDRYCNVFDPSNVSLKQQDKKIGHSDVVTVSDIYPFRAKNGEDKWDTIFGDKWPAIKKLCHDFNYGLLRASPLVILVGKSSSNIFTAMLKNDSALNVTTVFFKTSLKLFERETSFLVVCQAGSDEIKQLVFSVPHGARFCQGATVREGILADLIWNAVASMAGLDIGEPSRFIKMTYIRSEKIAAIAAGKVEPKPKGKPGPKPGTKKDSLLLKAAARATIKEVNAKQAAAGHPVAKAVGLMKRTTSVEKLEALLRSKEIRDYLSTPLDAHLLLARGASAIAFAKKADEHLRRWAISSQEDKLEESKTRTFMHKVNRYAIYYGPTARNGLRWHGDGGPDIDWAAYSNTPCPAVAINWGSLGEKPGRTKFLAHLNSVAPPPPADEQSAVLPEDEDE